MEQPPVVGIILHVARRGARAQNQYRDRWSVYRGRFAMGKAVMIQPIVPGDTPALVALASATGIFKPVEVQALREVLDDFHATNRAAGHLAVRCARARQAQGFAYFAPASMTDRTWYLWWIAVSKEMQGAGIGTALLRHAEEEITRRRGRQLLIETSSLPHYELTRRFYLKHGYRQVAALPDYYAEGDDMVVFGKRFGTPTV